MDDVEFEVVGFGDRKESGGAWVALRSYSQNLQRYQRLKVPRRWGLKHGWRLSLTW